MTSAKDSGPPKPGHDKSVRMLGLFMAALLAATVGCGGGHQPAGQGHVHVDRNNDGYCDEDGEPMPDGSGSRHGGYYGPPGYYYGSSGYRGPAAGSPGAGTGRAATISGGSAAHGGIGSMGSGGGG